MRYSSKGKEFKSELAKINKGKTKIRSAKSELENIQIPFTFQNNIIKLYDDYSSLVSKSKYKAKHGKELKIMTPKQMLQRLPIALTLLKKS